jgi:hypothetical protein
LRRQAKFIQIAVGLQTPGIVLRPDVSLLDGQSADRHHTLREAVLAVHWLASATAFHKTRLVGQRLFLRGSLGSVCFFGGHGSKSSGYFFFNFSLMHL